MNINVNGKPESIDPCSIAEYLAGRGLTGEGVVVEHNYRIVKRAEWPEVQLRKDDNLEILNFVGGG